MPDDWFQKPDVAFKEHVALGMAKGAQAVLQG